MNNNADFKIKGRVKDEGLLVSSLMNLLLLNVNSGGGALHW